MRGTSLSVSDLIQTEAKGALGAGDLDKLLKILEQVNKLLESPLGQMFMPKAPKGASPYVTDRIPEDKGPIVQHQPLPKAKEGLVPRSAIHEEIFKALNQMDEATLYGYFTKLQESGQLEKLLGGGKDEGEAVRPDPR